MKAIISLAFLCLCGCAATRAPILPAGVIGDLECEPSSYKHMEYPRIAVSGTRVFVQTVLGTTEYRIDSKSQKGTDSNFLWSISASEVSELSIGASGFASLVHYDPNIVSKVSQDQRAALYYAFVLRAGESLDCKRTSK